MVYELTDLNNAIAALDAKLNDGELAPFKMKIEFSLLQITTALKALSGIEASAGDSHNKYLLYKQLEATINEIQASIELDSRNHAQVKALAKSPEFLAVTQAKAFLIAQQKEWYPYYLAQSVQSLLDKDQKGKTNNLCIIVARIAENHQLDGKNKTDQIMLAVTEFAKITGFSLFDKSSSLKNKLKKWFEIEQEANIIRLFPTSSVKSKLSSNQ